VENTNNAPMIYSAINAVMRDCGAIGKNNKNQQQKFMFRGIDDVMNALQPVMVEHGIFVVPEVLDQTREERQTGTGKNLIYTVLKMRYTFYAKDGSSVQAVVTGEGMDMADKSANKAMSIAFKYACFQVFCIPTEEMQDPDAETPPPSIPKKLYCENCKKEIITVKNGDKFFAPSEIANKMKEAYGKELCWNCGIEERGKNNGK
jgi:hypothetical protein